MSTDYPVFSKDPYLQQAFELTAYQADHNTILHSEGMSLGLKDPSPVGQLTYCYLSAMDMTKADPTNESGSRILEILHDAELYEAPTVVLDTFIQTSITDVYEHLYGDDWGDIIERMQLGTDEFLPTYEELSRRVDASPPPNLCSPSMFIAMPRAVMAVISDARPKYLGPGETPVVLIESLLSGLGEAVRAQYPSARGLLLLHGFAFTEGDLVVFMSYSADGMGNLHHTQVFLRRDGYWLNQDAATLGLLQLCNYIYDHRHVVERSMPSFVHKRRHMKRAKKGPSYKPKPFYRLHLRDTVSKEFDFEKPPPKPQEGVRNEPEHLRSVREHRRLLIRRGPLDKLDNKMLKKLFKRGYKVLRTGQLPPEVMELLARPSRRGRRIAPRAPHEWIAWRTTTIPHHYRGSDDAEFVPSLRVATKRLKPRRPRAPCTRVQGEERLGAPPPTTPTSRE